MRVRLWTIGMIEPTQNAELLAERSQRLGGFAEDDIPFFLALVIRGMLVVLAVITVGAIASHLAAR